MDHLEELFEDIGVEYSMPPRPYPGLRPFEKEEWPIFFGREKMSGEIIDRLIEAHLVVVHGDSGSGKSSVARAGVQSQLEREHMRSGNRWRTVSTMPGNAPLAELAESIASLKSDSSDNFLAARRILNRGRDAANDLIEFLAPEDNEYFCIVVDQFEELFDFLRRNPSEWSQAKLFVDFLIGIAQARPDRIFVMLTMRSDYVGSCARFRDFAEVVNDTLYLLPAMSDAALVRAIRDPGRGYGIDISSELARKLIAIAGKGQDSLPLLQHGLLRIFEQFEGRVEETPAEELPLKLGQGDVGDVDFAVLLANHGDQIWDSEITHGRISQLDATHREQVAEKLFRGLMDRNADGQAVRRRVPLEQLAAEAGEGTEVARQVIRPFRADGVSFLRPFGSERLERDDQIDVSHESLIRQWPRLRSLLEQEFQAGVMWRDLLRAMDMKAVQGFVGGKRLAAFQEALDREQPNAAWAKRYGGRYEDVMAFVAECHDEDRKQKWRRRAIASLAVLGLMALPATYLYLTAQAEAQFRVKEAELAAKEAELDDAEARRAEINQQLAIAETTLAEANSQTEEALRLKEEAEASLAAADRETRAMQARNLELLARRNAIVKDGERVSAFAGAVVAQTTQNSLAGVFSPTNAPEDALAELEKIEGEVSGFTRLATTPDLKAAVDRDVALARAQIALARADWHRLQSNPDAEKTQLDQALRLVASSGGSAGAANAQAQAKARWGFAELHAENAERALPYFEQAIAEATPLVSDNPEARLTLAMARAGFAEAAHETGRSAEARESAKLCLDSLNSFVEERGNLTILANRQESDVHSRFFDCIFARVLARSPAERDQPDDDNFRTEYPALYNNEVIADAFRAADPETSARILKFQALVASGPDHQDFNRDGFLNTFGNRVRSTEATPDFRLANELYAAKEAVPTVSGLFNYEVESFLYLNDEVLDQKLARNEEGWTGWTESLLMHRDLVGRRLRTFDNERRSTYLRDYSAFLGNLNRKLDRSTAEPTTVALLLLASELNGRVVSDGTLNTLSDDVVRIFLDEANRVLEHTIEAEVLNYLDRYPFSAPVEPEIRNSSLTSNRSYALEALSSALNLCTRPGQEASICNDAQAAKERATANWTRDKENIAGLRLPLDNFRSNTRRPQQTIGGANFPLRVASFVAHAGLDIVAMRDALDERVRRWSEGTDAPLTPRLPTTQFNYNLALPSQLFGRSGGLGFFEIAVSAEEAVAESEGLAAMADEAADAVADAVADAAAVAADEPAAELAENDAFESSESAVELRDIVVPGVRGRLEFATVHGSSIYLFESRANLERFLEDVRANPETSKYLKITNLDTAETAEFGVLYSWAGDEMQLVTADTVRAICGRNETC